MIRVQFGGYIGCPLKGLYLQPSESRENLGVFRQMKAIGDREGVTVQAQLPKEGMVDDLDTVSLNAEGGVRDGYSQPWGQDNKAFFREGKNQTVVAGLSGESLPAEHFARFLLKKLRPLFFSPDGGNLFLGQDELARPFVLLGQTCFRRRVVYIKNHLRQWLEHRGGDADDILDNLFESEDMAWRLGQETRRAFAREFQVATERMLIVPQPDFHLDMAVRPLTYPDILVHERQLTLEIIDQAITESTDADERRRLAIARQLVIEEIKLPSDYATPSSQGKPYAPSQEVRRFFAGQGFEVTSAPGVIRGTCVRSSRYGYLTSAVPGSEDITPTNYLNAIVHQRANGRLLYITNASPFPTLDKVFARWLQKTCPEVEQVEFISGNISPDGEQDIAYFLKRDGGIHCLTTEEPDFERWKPLV